MFYLKTNDAEEKCTLWVTEIKGDGVKGDTYTCM